MELIYRIATEEDISLIRELADKIWKAYYPALISSAQIEYMLDKMYSTVSLKQQMENGHVFHVVYTNQLPIGYISLSSKDNKNYFLHKFYVRVEEHSKGIGSMVFFHILNELKHAESIELTVNRQNVKAI